MVYYEKYEISYSDFKVWNNLQAVTWEMVLSKAMYCVIITATVILRLDTHNLNYN